MFVCPLGCFVLGLLLGCVRLCLPVSNGPPVTCLVLLCRSRVSCISCVSFVLSSVLSFADLSFHVVVMFPVMPVKMFVVYLYGIDRDQGCEKMRPV